jgi:hypothetical protein
MTVHERRKPTHDIGLPVRTSGSTENNQWVFERHFRGQRTSRRFEKLLARFRRAGDQVSTQVSKWAR